MSICSLSFFLRFILRVLFLLSFPFWLGSLCLCSSTDFWRLGALCRVVLNLLPVSVSLMRVQQTLTLILRLLIIFIAVLVSVPIPVVFISIIYDLPRCFLFIVLNLIYVMSGLLNSITIKHIATLVHSYLLIFLVPDDENYLDIASLG